MIQDQTCPVCSSRNVMFSKKRGIHLCEDCGREFNSNRPPVPKRVFISYGHDNHATLAIRIRDDLRAQGHTVWFDTERLLPGHDWEAFIEQGLESLAADKANSVFLVLLTPHSVRRPDGYCLNEIARALGSGLRILPLMVIDSEPPLSICRIQWLDMRECIPIHEKEALYQPRFERLLKAVEDGVLDFEGNQQWLLKSLQPLQFEADILNHLPKFTGRQWVCEILQEWLKHSATRVFWITGGPGVGKTALSALLSNRYSEIAALHLCQHGHAQKGDPRSVITSVAYQLSTQLPEYEARLLRMDLERMRNDDARTLFDSLLVQPLARLSPPSRPIIILIDALDEATRDGRNELASFLAVEFEKTPAWLRLIVTSRPESPVTGPFQALRPFALDTGNDANRKDLRDYLLRELAVELQGRSEACAIVERILDRSEGVFLYVRHLCHSIHQGYCSLDRLDELPHGLRGIFWNFFERQFRDLESFRKNVRPALRVILAARSPIPIEELRRIFHWSREDLRDFIRSLGSLFTVQHEGEDETIQPCHKALTDWLVAEPLAGPYFTSEDEGIQTLADHCWNEYLGGVHAMSEFAVRHAPLYLVLADMHARAEELNRNQAFCERRRALGLDASAVGRVTLFGLTMARTGLIQEIDLLFGGDDATPRNKPGVIAICGRFLAGKTRCAIEYADTFSYRYAKTLLAEAQPDLLSAIAAACAKVSGSDAPIQTVGFEDCAAAVSWWMGDSKRALLVLDEVSEEQQQALIAVASALPSQIDILVTSECVEWPDGVQVLTLDGLAENEAVEFLLSSTKLFKPEEPDATDHARELARTLGCRPLALETASRIIVQERLSFADYLRTCKTKRIQ